MLGAYYAATQHDKVLRLSTTKGLINFYVDGKSAIQLHALFHQT